MSEQVEAIAAGTNGGEGSAAPGTAEGGRPPASAGSAAGTTANEAEHATKGGEPSASSPGKTHDRADLSPRAQAEAQNQRAAKGSSEEAVEKFSADLDRARSATGDRTAAIADLEKQVSEAQKSGTNPTKVAEMKRELDRLDAENNDQLRAMGDLQARLETLKSSGALTPEQARELEGKLSAIQQGSGDNKAKLSAMNREIKSLGASVAPPRTPNTGGDGARAITGAVKKGKHGEERKKGKEGNWDARLMAGAMAVIRAAGEGAGDGISSAALALLEDYGEARQSGARLKPETEQLVKVALNLAGLPPTLVDAQRSV